MYSFNYFNSIEQKHKLKKLCQNHNYLEVGTTMLSTMFEYGEIYKGFFARTMELALIRFGCVMTTLVDGALVTCPASPVGLPNDNGEYERFIGHTLTGKAFERTNHVDCVICYNNELGTPDRFIDFFAEMLTEVDTSLNCAIINSRNVPIPVGKDTKSIESIKKALKSIREGKEAYILDKNILDELENGVKSLEVLNITDVSSADKIQYLEKLHSDLIQRVATLYGQDFPMGNTKQAQQSIKEISGSESFSWIIPLSKRKQRKKWLEELKEMFGELILSDKVEFSESWLVQYKAFIYEPIEAQTEESINESIDESIDESMEEKEGGEHED